MKIIKVIFLLFLVLKSTGSFAISSNCCDGSSEQTEQTVIVDDTTNHDDDDGCCGGQCDCLCCSHIFTYQEVMELSLDDVLFVHKSDTDYIQPLYMTYMDALWQPPRCS